MQDDKQTSLTWSSPKNGTPAAPIATAPEPQAAAAQNKLGFPSGKKISHTQAPIYAGLLVVGIIAGMTLSAYWSPARQPEIARSATSTATSTQSATSTTPAAKTTPTAASVVVQDQKAGPSVAIRSLNIVRPTWVVVYVSREGKPGNALGARLFFASDKQGTVSLLRNTLAGQNYFVGLAVDDGDRKFSLSKDKPLADADGGPLWATFRAQ